MINPPPGFVVAVHDQAPTPKLLLLLLNSTSSLSDLETSLPE